MCSRCFQPLPGDVFEIITAGSVAGGFDQVIGDALAAGLTNLTKPMSALHSQAEELVQEEQRTKRPRVKKWQRWPGNGQTAIRADSPQPSFGPPGGQ